VGRKDTWKRWASAFSWPKSGEPAEETVAEYILDEQGHGPTGSPEGSRSNTIRAGEDETETGTHEPVVNENPDVSFSKPQKDNKHTVAVLIPFT
jgi:hypothetical protein